MVVALRRCVTGRVAIRGAPMTTDRIERLAEESEAALERALHAHVAPNDATAALTHLLWAFDARRRSREAIAIAETAIIASRVAR